MIIEMSVAQVRIVLDELNAAWQSLDKRRAARPPEAQRWYINRQQEIEEVMALLREEMR